jgi:hypothetical protein
LAARRWPPHHAAAPSNGALRALEEEFGTTIVKRATLRLHGG